MSAHGQLLIEDVFEAHEKDPMGKKFEKVSRFVCSSVYYEFDVQVDINIDIYPLEVGDKFNMALASTLSMDGTPDEGYYEPSDAPSIADKYEYVMYGKLYKYEEDTSTGQARVEAYLSFGGLLMLLKGDQSHLDRLKLDDRYYLLIRKV